MGFAICEWERWRGESDGELKRWSGFGLRPAGGGPLADEHVRPTVGEFEISFWVGREKEIRRGGEDTR